jgi:hypothetical protein
MPKSPIERKAAQRARLRDADLQQKIAILNQRKYQKCWEKFPVAESCLSGTSEFRNTQGWHSLKKILRHATT